MGIRLTKSQTNRKTIQIGPQVDKMQSGDMHDEMPAVRRFSLPSPN
jgi:hypothetical protein